MKIKSIFPLFFLTAGIFLSGCSKSPAKEPTAYDNSDIAMGTVVSQRIYSRGADKTGEILDLLTQTEHRYLSWRQEDSDIGKINQQAGKEPADVDAQTMAYLKESLTLAEKSGGAFDPTMGKLTRLWNVEAENPRVPSKEEIQPLLDESGYGKIHLKDEDGQCQAALEKGCSIDLGAVGKGIGCDEAAALLEKDENAQGAVVAVGGSVLTWGAKPDGTDWKVAIRDPRGEAEDLLGVLSLTDENYVSTSGDYEKYFIQDGKRYHHILDPATGRPADAGLISVTVLGENGLISDGLSTACFVLGFEKGAELLEKYDAQGIFVDEEKKVYVSEGLTDLFDLEASGYIVFPFPS